MNWLSAQPPKIFVDLFSGFDRPLSKALRHFQVPVLSLDILLNPKYDIFDDQFYESLLRICASGIVAYLAAAPCCGEYSRLKLQPGPGPKALRRPGELDGVPGLTASEMRRLQDSHVQLQRSTQCLELTFAGGGHGHLEQPSSVQAWLRHASCSCINLPACAFGLNIFKSWMFGTSFSKLECMASVCTHPAGAHESIAGARDASGQFLSRRSAQYPVLLAQKFSQLTHSLFSTCDQDLSLEEALRQIPQKSVYDNPVAMQDGGGLSSRPDWSMPVPCGPNIFQSLRKSMFSRILGLSLHKKLIGHFQNQSSTAPFSDHETTMR